MAYIKRYTHYIFQCPRCPKYEEALRKDRRRIEELQDYIKKAATEKKEILEKHDTAILEYKSKMRTLALSVRDLKEKLNKPQSLGVPSEFQSAAGEEQAHGGLPEPPRGSQPRSHGDRGDDLLKEVQYQSPEELEEEALALVASHPDTRHVASGFVPTGTDFNVQGKSVAPSGPQTQPLLAGVTQVTAGAGTRRFVHEWSSLKVKTCLRSGTLKSGWQT